MLKGKNLSNGFWADAINIAIYLKNRSPTKSLDFKTPFEYLYGFKPTVSHLRVFGSKIFAHIPKEDRKKLDVKALKCIYTQVHLHMKINGMNFSLINAMNRPEMGLPCSTRP